MALDSIRKPLPKRPAAELEERRRQARATLPTTKSPESAFPRYLRGSLEEATGPQPAASEELDVLPAVPTRPDAAPSEQTERDSDKGSPS